ncbi:MAG: peptidoglycan D,D-transpeptidase FtsI family protein [Opitutia bacterium]
MRESPAAEILPSTPVGKTRTLVAFWIMAAGMVYVLLGLAYRQLIQTGEIKVRSDSQSRRVMLIPPARGLIYDRAGHVLVENRVRWSVKADLPELQQETRAAYLRLLRAARAAKQTVDADTLLDQARIEVLQGWLDKVWSVIDTPERRPPGSRAKAAQRPLAAHRERKVNADELRKHMRERRALPFTLITDLTFPDPTGRQGAPSTEEGNRSAARFIEQFPSDGPIRLESDIVRSYPNGSTAAHVLGYVKDTDELPDPSALDQDILQLQKLRHVGKTGAAGVELTLDEVMKGASGWELWSKTSAGYNQELIRRVEPVQGAHVTLSLDLRIQRTAEASLARIRAPDGTLLPAAAVMIEVRTGEILAIASQPGFDPNLLADRVTSVYYDEIESKGGWLNRATQGLYAPGSTFKVINAIAAMRKGTVRWDEVLDCGPSFRVGNRDFPEHTPEGYGPVDLEVMLAVSCNVWNYQVGLRTGVDAIAAEARRFGLDAQLLNTPMGTELPYPAGRGLVVPDAAYKSRIGAGSWSPGDTANMSIGQGYLLTTPLHMACVAASVARGETRTVPTIIHDPRRDGKHTGAEPIGLRADQMAALRSGMERCVEEGTARSVQIPGLPYAAKTGTSEYFKDGKKAHLGWFIGYAPAHNPVVAFCVLIEGEDDGTWGGKTAGPVARDMLLQWTGKPTGFEEPVQARPGEAAR